mgnify:CR=1 FL=1
MLQGNDHVRRLLRIRGHLALDEHEAVAHSQRNPPSIRSRQEVPATPFSRCQVLLPGGEMGRSIFVYLLDRKIRCIAMGILALYA